MTGKIRHLCEKILPDSRLPVKIENIANLEGVSPWLGTTSHDAVKKQSVVVVSRVKNAPDIAATYLK